MITRKADRGSATVWVLILMTLVGAVAVVAGAWGGAAVLRHRAGAVADAAALAAAARTLAGPGPMCEEARRIAMANHGRLTSCTVQDGRVTVTTEVAATDWLRLLGPAHGRARAERIPDRYE